jgi:hypothetical protein
MLLLLFFFSGTHDANIKKPRSPFFLLVLLAIVVQFMAEDKLWLSMEASGI